MILVWDSYLALINPLDFLKKPKKARLVEFFLEIDAAVQ